MPTGSRSRGWGLASIGAGIGLSISVALTRLVSNLLFEVSATDPFVFGDVSLVLAFVAFAACYLARPL